MTRVAQEDEGCSRVHSLRAMPHGAYDAQVALDETALPR